MRLDAEAVRDITRGTEIVTECDGKISFFRFTPEQAEMYRKYRCEDYCLMTNSTADVRMAFRTDSEQRLPYVEEFVFDIVVVFLHETSEFAGAIQRFTHFRGISQKTELMVNPLCA